MNKVLLYLTALLSLVCVTMSSCNGSDDDGNNNKGDDPETVT